MPKNLEAERWIGEPLIYCRDNLYFVKKIIISFEELCLMSTFPTFHTKQNLLLQQLWIFIEKKL